MPKALKLNKPKKKAPKRVYKLSEEQYIHRLLQDKKTSGSHKMELFHRLQEIWKAKEQAKLEAERKADPSRADKLRKLLDNDGIAVTTADSITASCATIRLGE